MTKWNEIKMVVSLEASEPVSAMLYEIGVSGLYLEDPRDFLNEKRASTDWDYIEENLCKMDPNQVIIHCYFPEMININEKIALLKEKLLLVTANCGIDTGNIEINQLNEEDWASNWKKYYHPIALGERLVIKPTWELFKAEPGQVIIELDPGMAFGTGTHETTRMCLTLLDKYITTEMNVLDIGCGSGILGIGAVKLGASRCIAVDLDENAVRIANENANLNKVTDQMEIRHGNLVEVVSGKFELVIANIIADAVMMLGELIKPLLSDKAIYIVSGIINERAEEVKDKLISLGYTLLEHMTEGEWTAFAVERK